MREKLSRILPAAPSVSLIQPITRGASGLAGNLAARFGLDYAGRIEHILVCDAGDEESMSVCRAAMEACSDQDCRIVPIVSEFGTASKIDKMKAGVAAATGEVICFIDDDVAPRPDNLTSLVRELAVPDAGGVFGIACYTNWRQPGSALMSGFVNLNALFTYIPLTYLVQPFTVTGHFFAVRREAWEECGGLDGLDPDRNDDDHEIARRLRAAGRRNIQSEAIYDVDNALPSLRDYHRQMQRWSAFMRLWCRANMCGGEVAASLFNMIGNALPLVAFSCAALAPRPVTFCACAAMVFAMLSVYSYCAAAFLKQPPTPARLFWVFAAAFAAPLQMLISPLWGDVVEWRGRRYRAHSGGILEPIE